MAWSTRRALAQTSCRARLATSPPAAPRPAALSTPSAARALTAARARAAPALAPHAPARTPPRPMAPKSDSRLPSGVPFANHAYCTRALARIARVLTPADAFAAHGPNDKRASRDPPRCAGASKQTHNTQHATRKAPPGRLTPRFRASAPVHGGAHLRSPRVDTALPALSPRCCRPPAPRRKRRRRPAQRARAGQTCVLLRAARALNAIGERKEERSLIPAFTLAAACATPAFTLAAACACIHACARLPRLARGAVRLRASQLQARA